MTTFTVFLSFTGALLCIALAAYVLFKDPRSFVHRAFAVGMLTLGFLEVFIGMGIQADVLSEVIRWERRRLVASVFLPGSWLFFSLSFARSNYKDLIAKWKWFILASFVIPSAIIVFFSEAFFMKLPAPNDGPISSIPLGWSGYVLYLLSLLTAVMVLVNLEETLRASSGGKRWQIKFMVLGLGSLLAVQIYIASQTILFSSVSLSMDRVNTYTILVADILILLALARKRLLDVEIHLSPAFLYNSMTVMVVGAYLLGVGVLAKVIGPLGGDFFPLEMFFVFVSMLVLAVLLLSNQLRHNIKRFISRNFYRHRYDYRKEWMTFTQRTASLVDTKDLCAAVSRMVSETFGVAAVTVWLLDEESNQVTLGGSTAFSGAEPPHLRGAEMVLEPLRSLMRHRQAPLDFDAFSDSKAKELRESYPDYFEDARIRYCAPLAAGQRWLGWISLGERMKKEPFSVEDFDLLKTIADQAAGSLLNLRLSERLLKAKEMEAFQALSAFFIHDLKNLASTLSLTMRNLPVHFDNPEFRNDALRVISHSVSKMNAMCGRLSLLTKRMELQRTKTDLNELVTTTLAGLNGSIKGTLAQSLRPLPNLFADPEQIQKVLLNLILNANEAVGPSGEIRVETSQRGDWAVFSVRDNGCGMPKEFMSRSLFQPFQTTKSEGLGIGLFHSKKIVEAHHGKIEVESEEGVGTTFQVILPIVQS